MNDRERRKASHSHQLNVEGSNTSVGKLLEIIIEPSRRQRGHEKKLAKCKSHFVTLISYFISFSSGHHTHYWFMSCPILPYPSTFSSFFLVSSLGFSNLNGNILDQVGSHYLESSTNSFTYCILNLFFIFYYNTYRHAFGKYIIYRNS